MLNITLQQLRYAVEIAKEGSISQAAKNLYINQPNMSRAIKDLETALGISVFTRTSKGVVPTLDGALFLEHAKKVLKELDTLELELKDSRLDQANFHVSIPRATYITYAFTEFFRDIQDMKEIGIDFRETNTADAIDNILINHFEMAIIRTNEEEFPGLQDMLHKNGLIFEELWKNPYLVLLSEHHPLHTRKVLKLQDLPEYTELIHGDEKYETRHTLGEPAKRIYLYERGSQFDLLRKIPSTYMWVSPLPQEILDCHHLVQIPCENRTDPFIDLLVYKQGHHFSFYEKQFLMTLEKVIREL